nr:hypothetical protein Iba_chr11bCG8380 [Ipomoea batatas]
MMSSDVAVLRRRKKRSTVPCSTLPEPSCHCRPSMPEPSQIWSGGVGTSLVQNHHRSGDWSAGVGASLARNHHRSRNWRGDEGGVTTGNVDCKGVEKWRLGELGRCLFSA